MDRLEIPAPISLNGVPSSDTNSPREGDTSQSMPERVWRVRGQVRALTHPWDIGHLMGAGLRMAAAYRVVGLMRAVACDESTRTLAAVLTTLGEITELLDCGTEDEGVERLHDALAALGASLRFHHGAVPQPSRLPPGYVAEATETSFNEEGMIQLGRDEAAIERQRSGYRELGEALARVQLSGRLARHPTFDEYVVQRWELTPLQARRLILAAAVARNVTRWTQRAPANEGQALSLARLQSPADQAHVWEELVVDAGEEPVTSRMVRNAVARFVRKYGHDAPEFGDVEASDDGAARAER